MAARKFIQNTVINYGPYNGYIAGEASIAEMNYFANQSNLMHDGAQIQVMLIIHFSICVLIRNDIVNLGRSK